MAIIPKLKLTYYLNGELFTTITDKRDKDQLQNYINTFLVPLGVLKQDLLIAGKDISIDNNVISYTGSGGGGSTILIDGESFIFINKTLTLLDDKVRHRFNELLTYSNLKTLDKTILGAINELYSFSKITVDTISFSLVNNFLKLNDDAISKRFNEVIEYPNLKTVSKKIIGAINELYSSPKITVDPDSFGFTNNNLTLRDTLVFGRFLTDLISTNFPSLNTNNKTFIGAINENHTTIENKQQKFTIDNSLKLESKPTIGEVLSVVTASDGIVARALLQTNEYNDDLTTNDKRIIPAINENHEVINTIQGRIDGLSLTILGKIDDLVLTKQDITDNTLITTNKTIVGAINENHTAIQTKQQKFTIDNSLKLESKPSVGEVLSVVTDSTGIVARTLLQTNEYNDDLNTNDKRLIPAINEILAKIPVPPARDLTPSERMIMPKMASTDYTFDPKSFKVENNIIELQDDLIKERFNFQKKIIGDKTTLTSGADGYVNEKNQIRIYDAPKEPVALRIVKFNKYDNLETENQTLIGAINELQATNKQLTQVFLILNEKCKKIQDWKEVGELVNNNEQINYDFILGKTYKVWYHFGNAMDTGGMPRSYISKEFLYNGQFSRESSHYLDYWQDTWGKKYYLEIFEYKIILHDPEKSPSISNGQFLKLEELQ